MPKHPSGIGPEKQRTPERRRHGIEVQGSARIKEVRTKTRRAAAECVFPEITHLQFLVLANLIDSDESGPELRDRLAKQGEARTGPAFYQLMARLEEAGYVEGWYDEANPKGFAIPPRHYRITAVGRTAWERTVSFYEEQKAQVIDRLARTLKRT